MMQLDRKQTPSTHGAAYVIREYHEVDREAPARLSASHALQRDAKMVEDLFARKNGAQLRFVQNYDRFIRSVVRASSPRARSMIDDLTHDIYLHLWCEDFRVLRRWRRVSPLQAFLSVTVKRFIWAQLRVLQPTREGMDYDLATGNRTEEAAEGPTPEDEIIQRQRDEFVRTAVRMLSANHRSVVEMRYFRGLAYGEIAQQLGITPTNVGVRLNRAHTNLRRVLAPIHH